MGLLLSIDVGGSTIHLAEGSRGKTGLSIEKASELPVPEGAVENGRITQASVIAEIIRDLLKKEKYKARHAVITTNAANAVIREITLPKAKPKELDAMIRTEMIQTYHIDESDVLQYKKIGFHRDENGAEMDTYQAAALNAQMVDEYYELVRLLKLKNLFMDINTNAIDKLLHLSTSVNDRPVTDMTCLFTDIGAFHTTAYVESGGEQKLFRHISIGAGEIERAIADETFTAPEEIRKKKEGGLNLFSGNQTSIQYYEILKPYFYNLTEEIRKIIRYYYNRSEISSIDRVFLFGGGSKLVGLSGYLEENLSLPVEPIESLLGVSGNFSKGSLLTHLNAFGALIRY